MGVGHPERSVDEEVDARQRGRSPTVLGCGRLELKKRHRSREKRNDRSGRDARDARPRGSYQETGAEEHIQEARRALGSGGKAGAKERRKSANRAGLRKLEQETALDVGYSELKREFKEIKWARRRLEVAGAEDREDVATGDTLCGAAFVKPPALGAVQRQKRSQLGSRSSSVFRGARGKDHDPVASKLAIWVESNPGILAGHRNLRELETLSEIMDKLAAGQFGRAADVATQRYKAIDMAMQDGDWNRASHLELLPDAKRLLTGRDEQELITRELRHEMRLRTFLDEGRAPWRKGSDAKGKGQEKGKHSDKVKKRTPASQGPVQRKVQRQGQSFRGESLSNVGSSSSEESDLHPLVGALARVDLLAGAPALDAYLFEGEHASSPVGKAPKGSGLGPFGCPEPFFRVDGAKLVSVSCAAKRLRRWMLGGWSGEKLALVRRWERFWNC